MLRHMMAMVNVEFMQQFIFDYMQCQYVGIFSLPQLRRMASYSDDILLNIPLAPVTLSQLSTCLSKATVTETSLLL